MSRAALVAAGILLLSGCSASTTRPEGCIEDPFETSSGLVLEDLQCGGGLGAERGDTLEVSWRARLGSGEPVEIGQPSEPGEPAGGAARVRFRLGSAQVIRGWDDGLVGMQEGAVRRLRIPPELAFGEGGYPPVVPPNATMVFEVELLTLRASTD